MNRDREFERRIEAALLYSHFDIMNLAISNFVWWLEAHDVMTRLFRVLFDLHGYVGLFTMAPDY